MFRMPKDAEAFAKNRLPGNYEKLKKKYKEGAVVKEMDSIDAKRLCVLKGMDSEGICYLGPISEEAGIIKVYIQPKFAHRKKGMKLRRLGKKESACSKRTSSSRFI